MSTASAVLRPSAISTALNSTSVPMSTASAVLRLFLATKTIEWPVPMSTASAVLRQC